MILSPRLIVLPLSQKKFKDVFLVNKIKKESRGVMHIKIRSVFIPKK